MWIVIVWIVTQSPGFDRHDKYPMPSEKEWKLRSNS